MGAHKKNPDQRKLYAVYNAKTDELLAFGNAEQCAKLLDMKNEISFRKMVWLFTHGKMKRYVVVIMDGYGEDE
jgi:hypothetical protein